ncbi:hypothetical protein ACH9L7_19985 (plasmid) [Haloferax sp. S1W]|uniref:hypothetical protein n=1 Tax=Haloferax sp. S1W TaxID=3377110 RepID=UPI0037C7BF74
MTTEITITVTIGEEDEVPAAVREFIGQQLGGGGDAAQVEADSDGATDEDSETRSYEEMLNELPSDEHRYVFRALVQNRGRARRVIHRAATQFEDSPFDDFDPDNETSERGRIGELLWELQRLDYAYHDGNKWFPESEKFTESALSW